jgi:hypothetical protein
MAASPTQLAMSADASAMHPLGHHPAQGVVETFAAFPAPQQQPIQPNPRKRRASGQQQQQLAPNAIAPAPPQQQQQQQQQQAPPTAAAGYGGVAADPSGFVAGNADLNPPPQQPPPKKGRTNTPWTPAEEQRLKAMRDAGNSWSEIAKVRKRGKNMAGGNRDL